MKGSSKKRLYWFLGIIFLIIIVSFVAFALTSQSSDQKFDSGLIKAVESGIPPSEIIPQIELNKNLMIQEADISNTTVADQPRTINKTEYDQKIAIANEYYALRVSYVKGQISKETFLAKAKQLQQQM